ncbi:MAG: DUF4198 domain-containing protein [Desulfobulbaceae bacterium]|uniref:DUF4198 domain-containing protein n=1 Tax=Candidatus Desulfobia pelagia TaxID=2841692 RepID=A0A8J6ND87_9BACT|nr:DUF4198 domain-containing protein [Candidatus Desulfobia pelagia]
MFKKSCFVLSAVFLAVSIGSSVDAHFLQLIPSQNIVTGGQKSTLQFDIRFSHPMENGPVMHMDEPVSFFVQHNGVQTDLKNILHLNKITDKNAYTASFKIKEPGDHIFGFEPAPYWEPSEQKMIIHYTKVVVNAFGAEEGWDEPLRFPVEIDPLTRPYGLWTGNSFRGVVKKNGRPVPFAPVEVEYLNSENKVDIPSDPFVTQVITTDINGVFIYTMPRSGWWGFAALLEGDELVVSPEGKRVEGELGALIWVKCVDMGSKK